MLVRQGIYGRAISKHRVDDECVEEKCATDNAIEIETKAKLQLVLQNSHYDESVRQIATMPIV